MSMKITSGTKERSCNNSPRAESKETLHFKIAYARYACLCFIFVNVSRKPLLLAFLSACFFFLLLLF